jgi:cytochrome c oxidase subunit 1
MRNGPIAGNNPWHATGLEWQTTSPPPPENFTETPVVGEPYQYEPEGGFTPQITATVPEVVEEEQRG